VSGYSKLILVATAAVIISNCAYGSEAVLVGGATATVTISSSGLNGTTDSGAPVSPYTGAISAITGGGVNGSISLFCDDYNNSYPTNDSVTNYVITAIGSSTTSYNATRFASLTSLDTNTSDGGSSSADVLTTGSPTLPTSTDLYEQLAWLYNELMNAQSAGNGNEMIAIQEAAWDMTDPSGVRSAQTETTAAQDWIALAKTDYSAASLSGSYNANSLGAVTLTTTNYADWFVIDSTSSSTSIGCSGSGNSCGSAAGNSAETTGTQEFLAYHATPEPATFGLMGLALLAGGLVRRRKSTR
jgi:hypothetical protein